MKIISALALTVAVTVPPVFADEIHCTITRATRHHMGGIATDHVVEDLNYRREPGARVATGYIRSFLLPYSARIVYGFSVSGRDLRTRLAMETRELETGFQIAYDESYGSVANPPSSVENRFRLGRDEFSVECSLRD